MLQIQIDERTVNTLLEKSINEQVEELAKLKYFMTYNELAEYLNLSKLTIEDRLIKNGLKYYVEGVFHGYMDYMKDEMKNGQLFSVVEDIIKEERLEEVRELYAQAEEKGSPLWKDVLSFDNDWLEEQGLYKGETHWLNEKKMKEIVRGAMNKMIEEEKMHDPIWTASFHYNTDNIHVHIATVELDPSHLPLVHGQDKETKELLFDEQGEPILQRRGWRKDKTRMAVRSSVANQIVDRSKAYKRIDELIRDTATKTKTIDLMEVQEVSHLFEQTLQYLPK